MYSFIFHDVVHLQLIVPKVFFHPTDKYVIVSASFVGKAICTSLHSFDTMPTKSLSMSGSLLWGFLLCSIALLSSSQPMSQSLFS